MNNRKMNKVIPKIGEFWQDIRFSNDSPWLCRIINVDKHETGKTIIAYIDNFQLMSQLSLDLFIKHFIQYNNFPQVNEQWQNKQFGTIYDIIKVDIDNFPINIYCKDCNGERMIDFNTFMKNFRIYDKYVAVDIENTIEDLSVQKATAHILHRLSCNVNHANDRTNKTKNKDMVNKNYKNIVRLS